MLELRTMAAILSTDTVVLVVMLALVALYLWNEKRKTDAAAAKQAEQEAAPVAAAVEEVPAPKAPEAKGTAGTILLHDVPEREAAMVMAVVAHRLGKPLNQLRFKSIREVKDK